MKFILPNFRKARILVVGDIILDRYLHGSIVRISQEASTPVVHVNSIKEQPGGSANVAVNITSIGAKSHLIGLTGADDAACIIGKKLRSANVTYDFITTSKCPTIIKLRVLSNNKQLIRLDFEKKYSIQDTIGLIERIELIIKEFNALVLSDYNKGTLQNIQKIIMLARSVNVPVLVDPKGCDFTRYKGATILTPNLSEFESVVGYCKNETILLNRGMSIISECKLQALLITRSEHGMTLLQPSKDPLYFQSKAQKVYDVTGAGDTVISILAASFSSGSNIEESCFLANIAAGLVVEKFGVSTVNYVDLEDAIKK